MTEADLSWQHITQQVALWQGPVSFEMWHQQKVGQKVCNCQRETRLEDLETNRYEQLSLFCIWLFNSALGWGIHIGTQYILWYVIRFVFCIVFNSGSVLGRWIHIGEQNILWYIVVHIWYFCNVFNSGSALGRWIHIGGGRMNGMLCCM